MLLQGSLREFNLPNILQLVEMNSATGALSLVRDGAHGKIYFNQGSICYAYVVPQSLPIGQRLVNAGHITPAQLRASFLRQKEASGSTRLGATLLEMGLIDRETLEQVVGEQIRDAVFDFFGWPNGHFEFNDDEVASGQDIFVELQVEKLIMESCRRIDELEFILEELGSLESVPRLARGLADDLSEVTFSAEEWACAVHIDGHRDINTVLLAGDFDRFYGAKIMRGLYKRGLITIAPPAIWSIGEGVSVAVRGSADVYNEVFVTTLAAGNVVHHLRVEMIDDHEVEIPIVAGRVRVGIGDDDGTGILVFSVAASAPQSAVGRFAGPSSAWILLADVHDEASVRAMREHVDFVQSLGSAPFVVAAYAPIVGEGLSPEQVAAILELDAAIPVIPCRLRDTESVSRVIMAVARRLQDSATAVAS